MRGDLDTPLPLLQLEGLRVAAGDAITLDVPSLDIVDGPPTAIIGPNGAGKTTLLRVLMGLLQPTAGTVLTGTTARAIVFQKPVMLRRSAAANVAFALAAAGHTADRAAVDTVLSEVGLTHLSDRPARRLSGGEQQRLAIARALARRPQLLLLDEATASLDPAQTRLIESLIAAIAARGVKIVFATHDLGQARRLAGDIVFLAGGRVAECAPAAMFFTSPRTDTARRFLAGDLVLQQPRPGDLP